MLRQKKKQKNGPNERSKLQKKIQLSDKETANLSDAQFKTLVIRMLTEMVEDGRKIEEEVKAMKSEIKVNVQGTNNEGKEIRTQINGLEQTEEINIQPEWNEETRIQKNEERHRGHLETFQHPNYRGSRRKRGRTKN